MGQFPGKTQAAREWYRNAAKNVSYANINTIMKSENAYLVDKPKIGQMMIYRYSAKHADTLPYWDAVPVGFVVDYTDTGFYMLNMHYISPQLRAKLMDALYTTINNNK